MPDTEKTRSSFSLLQNSGAMADTDLVMHHTAAERMETAGMEMLRIPAVQAGAEKQSLPETEIIRYSNALYAAKSSGCLKVRERSA